MKLILQKVKQNQLTDSVTINQPTNTTIEMNVSPKYLHSVLTYYYDLLPFYSSKKLVGINNKYPINSIYYKYLIALKSWIGKHITPDVQVPTAIISNSNNFNKDFSLLLQHSKIDISTEELNNPNTTFRSFLFTPESVPFVIIDNNYFSDLLHITNPNFKIEIFMKPNFSFELSTYEGRTFGVTTEELVTNLEELHYQFDIDKTYLFRGYKAADTLPKTIEQEDYKKVVVTQLYNTWLTKNIQEKNQITHINFSEIELISKGYLVYIPILVPGDNISSYTTLNRILNYIDKYTGFTKLNTPNKKSNLLSRLDVLYCNHLSSIEEGFAALNLDKSFFSNSFINPNLAYNNNCYLDSITGLTNEPIDYDKFFIKTESSSLKSIFFEHIINKFPFKIGQNPFKDETIENIGMLIKYWLCIRRITGDFSFIFNANSSLTDYYFEEEKLLLSNYSLRIPKSILKSLISSLTVDKFTTPLFTYKESNNIKKDKKKESTNETAKSLINVINNLKNTNPELDATIKQLEFILNKDNDERSK